MRGRAETKSFVDGCWNSNIGQYNDLCYDRSKLSAFETILLDEQKDSYGSYCCYCMRKLYVKSNGCPKSNITFEHIIPHKITKADWERFKIYYQDFPNLNEKHLIICYEGNLTEDQKNVKLTRMPYPHMVSYHNLVASCDGTTFEQSALKSSNCCNNNRQERFVLPFYLSKDLTNELSYTRKGELDFNDSLFDSEWFDNMHLNLNSAWLVLVRKIWYKVANSDYTDSDVESARLDKELRQNIIDDIDLNNEISSWGDNDQVWNLFSEYSWFYHYYKEM